MLALSDGYVHPTGKSVMYPIPHVYSLTLSQSRIHIWGNSGLIMFRHIPVHPLPDGLRQPCTPYLTHTCMTELPDTC